MKTFSNALTEYTPQMEMLERPPESESPAAAGRTVFNDEDEVELTVALLELRDETELEYFLSDLIKKAGKALGKAISTTTGSAIGNLLKGAVRKALPIAGAALGTWVAGPLGAQLGKGLVESAGRKLGLELEGLSPEDGEFQAARQFVKFAGESVRHALETADAEPHEAAHYAVAEAGRTHAPGLVELARAPRRSGQWVRRNGNIIVFGI